MLKLYKFYPSSFDRQRYWEDKYAQEHIAGKSTDDFRRQGFWPLLQSHLSKDKLYLDAGCGIGGWILFLREEGYHVEGIDIAARTVRALTEYDQSLKVKIAPITRIPYPDQYFDGLLAIGTLEYVEDKVPQALQEIRRVLKDDGIVFMEVPLANTLRRWFYLPLKKLEFHLKGARGQQPVFANYLFMPATLRQLLRRQQFEILDIQPHELPETDGHYGLYVDWRIFRSGTPYHLNPLGILVKTIVNAISPWAASTGMVVVARKKAGKPA